MRIFNTGLCLALAACGSAGSSGNASSRGAERSAGDSDSVIACGRGTGSFDRSCTIERAQGDRGTILTLRNPDGAFHRLLVTPDGRRVVAADGADYAVASVATKDAIEVRIDGGRYRLPYAILGPSS